MVRLSRVSIIHLMLVVFAILLLGQAARVQLIQGEQWAERARRQQFRTREVEAPRGKILDASGNVLAESRELYRISIAPTEVKNGPALSTAMRAAGFDAKAIASAADLKRKWVTLPGLHVAASVAPIMSQPGVHAETVLSREYVSAAGIRRVVGALDATGRAAGGIELALDSVLRGDSASASVARDVRGRRLDSPDAWLSAPRAGSTVSLTINRDLQEICERALARAVDSLDATGGDIVVLNPSTGEILAMAGVRRTKLAMSVTAVTEPFEPGSTLKPFFAAALLERKRAHADEVVNTHGGVLTIGDRTITDLRKAESMSLAEVIRYSSNIGMVEFGSRLTPRETFETLRDLGFGTPTGLPIPGEANGTLREPARWRGPSAASLAMGYEIAVTPIQLVAAYAVLANGGTMMQPHIVREIRDADGALVYQSKPRVLRRVFSEPVAGEVRRLLRSVVDSGTAVKADLATFQMAGKSGTARRTSQGRYIEGNYTASFVGLFPAERPQYVVLVKLDSPRGAYFGGEIAAPVSAVVLRAALAARDAALNRGELAGEERDVPLPSSAIAARDTAGDDSALREAEAPREPAVFGIDPAPYGEKTQQPATLVRLPFARAQRAPDLETRPVPDVAALTMREAVRALHRAGFRVTLASAQTVPTLPAAGTLLAPGSFVKLRHIP